jgi:hypothetical protein
MDPGIKTFIEGEMVDFGIAFQTERKSFLSKKISASGDLSDSIDYAIDQQAREDTAAIMLNFAEHGRYIDMKRLQAVMPSGANNDYVKAIEDWIRVRGWEQKFIAAFVKKHPTIKVTPSVLRRIAWGIVYNRAFKMVRRKRWYNGKRTASVADLFNTVVAGLPDVTGDIFKKAFAK